MHSHTGSIFWQWRWTGRLVTSLKPCWTTEQLSGLLNVLQRKHLLVIKSSC